jgi:uncharacterized OsmC-like protein
MTTAIETPVEHQTRTVELEHIDQYRFRIAFGEGLPTLIADEPPPLGTGTGPEASRFLAAAIGNCLSASLFLCLQKSRVIVEAMRTSVTLTMGRNEQGRLRIARGDVQITLQTSENAGKVDRCLGMFEDYCTVTATLRKAFPISVTVSRS